MPKPKNLKWKNHRNHKNSPSHNFPPNERQKNPKSTNKFGIFGGLTEKKKWGNKREERKSKSD